MMCVMWTMRGDELKNESGWVGVEGWVDGRWRCVYELSVVVGWCSKEGWCWRECEKEMRM